MAAEKTYNLLYKGTKAICPGCSGILAGAPDRKKCIDCGRVYIVAGEGITESELAFKEVTGGETTEGE